MKLFARVLGEGTPLVVLHGVFGSSDNLFTVCKKISEQGFAVHILDARNHGQSPRSDGFSYEEMAADLAEYIFNNGLDKPIVIGHSMGGKTVLQFAALSNNFSKLIIVDIAPRFYPTHHEHIIRGLSAIMATSITSRKEAEDIFSNYVEDLGERQFILKNLYRNEKGEFDWRINISVLSRDIYMVGSEISFSTVCPLPVLLMRGEASSYVTDEDFRALQIWFPNAQLATIPNANHWIHATQPAAFVEEVVKFART
jgi:esterase